MPRRGKLIDWKNSVGYKIDFVYDDVDGTLEIVDYNKNRVFVKYNGEIFDISNSNLKTCKLGKITKKITNDFKINIGNRFNNIKRDITIVDRKNIYLHNTTFKYYKYYCNKCSYEGWISESHLLHNIGCSCCAGQIISIGINDIGTTTPQLIKFLANKEDAYKYTCNSGKQIKVRCPVCNKYEVYMTINNLNRKGFSCKYCGDGISYPEKIVYHVLKQLSFDFVAQLSKKDMLWIGEYYYDFYIPHLQCIIEAHGRQHYEDVGFPIIYEEQKEIDKVKKELALKNGIKHYIVVDCRESNIDYIKKSIIKSLSELINLDNTDWKLIEEQSLKSFVKETCDIKKENPNYTITEIGKIMGLHRKTIREYLKKGNKIGWCNYNPVTKRRAVCLNTRETFNLLTNASLYAGLKDSGCITRACQGKQKSAGKHPKTGEPLQWMYYEDYVEKYGYKEYVTIDWSKY